MTVETTQSKAPVRDTTKGYIIRFNVGQRVEHTIQMVTFTLLSITGLAQKFYTAAWANWVIQSLGGIAYTRLIHRVFAVIFMLSFVYHFAVVFYNLFAKHRKATMLFSVKDVRDVLTELRYSLGFVDKLPQFGRYDYKQKFEYWGVIFGGIIITLSGLVLMFPVFVTQITPGWVVAAAKEFHGNEATLAVIIIIMWHLYDVILRPGIFPIDKSVHTGKISIKRMEEEHPLELAEIMGTKSEEKEGAANTDTPAPG